MSVSLHRDVISNFQRGGGPFPGKPTRLFQHLRQLRAGNRHAMHKFRCRPKFFHMSSWWRSYPASFDRIHPMFAAHLFHLLSRAVCLPRQNLPWQREFSPHLGVWIKFIATGPMPGRNIRSHQAKHLPKTKRIQFLFHAHAVKQRYPGLPGTIPCVRSIVPGARIIPAPHDHCRTFNFARSPHFTQEFRDTVQLGKPDPEKFSLLLITQAFQNRAVRMQMSHSPPIGSPGFSDAPLKKHVRDFIVWPLLALIGEDAARVAARRKIGNKHRTVCTSKKVFP